MRGKLRNDIKRGFWKVIRTLKLEKAARKIWNIFKMHIYEKVQIHTYDPSLHPQVIYLFGRRIGQKQDREDATDHIQQKRIVYFKINREADYTMMCVQHWINIADILNAKLYFVCDNKNLERTIVRNSTFRDGSTCFIRSRRRELKHIAENIYTDFWGNATYAHLTPFYHAQENGFAKYWTIDADDTMFLLAPHRVAQILQDAEIIAEEKNASAFSLDMWRSKTLGRHWSLGIVYIRNNGDLCRLFEKNEDLNWTEDYQWVGTPFNIDWFFNYLKDHKLACIESFYVENCYFIHWGDLMRNTVGSGIFIWSDGKLILPIMKSVYQNERLGTVPIADCWKIDIGLDELESRAFMENELSLARLCGKGLRELNGLGNFCRETKYFY